MSLYASEDLREGPLGVETSDGARGKIGHGGSVSSSGVPIGSVTSTALTIPPSILDD